MIDVTSLLAGVGALVLVLIAIIVLLCLPWKKWWCSLTNGHEYEYHRSKFFWLEFGGERCKHCGKYKK